ncbi:MAG TPA: DUF1345 domain-containing protein [Candidatus Tumulicola sp.]
MSPTRKVNVRALAPIAVSVVTAAIVAVAIGFFGPSWLRSMVRVVAVYDAAVLAILLYYWRVVMLTDAADTKRRAASQDPGRDVVFVAILLAVGFGLLAAIAILGRGPHDEAPHHAAAIYALGFGAVVLGWLLIHTIFLFHYAHLYYSDWRRDKEGDRGLIFPGTNEPNDIDFAYFSFVLGMTFQVSDVQITDRRIRRPALAHGMISFAYNTAILAVVVNIVSNLLH